MYSKRCPKKNIFWKIVFEVCLTNNFQQIKESPAMISGALTNCHRLLR
jgi:hypothetical protein